MERPAWSGPPWSGPRGAPTVHSLLRTCSLSAHSVASHAVCSSVVWSPSAFVVPAGHCLQTKSTTCSLVAQLTAGQRFGSGGNVLLPLTREHHNGLSAATTRRTVVTAKKCIIVYRPSIQGKHICSWCFGLKDNLHLSAINIYFWGGRREKIT